MDLSKTMQISTAFSFDPSWFQMNCVTVVDIFILHKSFIMEYMAAAKKNGWQEAVS